MRVLQEPVPDDPVLCERRNGTTVLSKELPTKRLQQAASAANVTLTQIN
jgi:hypothetical protein